MSRRIIASLATLGLALSSALAAEPFEEYLKLRKKHGIEQSVGVAALETLVGRRIIEVKGVVKGVFAVNQSVLLLEACDGGYIHVQGQSAPDWLLQTPVSARLLVEAERPEIGGELTVHLLGAASEHRMEAYEAELARKEQATKAKLAKERSDALQRGTRPKTWNLPASAALPHYASFIKGRNPRLSDSEATRIAQGVLGFSIQYGVDARLVMAMILVESGFNPQATSRAGAMGLGQLMPGTARGMGVSNAYDSIDNLYGTVRLIRGHLEKYSAKVGPTYEALVLALAAYNAGSGAVRKHGGVPPYEETQNYIRKVVTVYRRLSGA
jgi:hypothetical protein